MKRSFATQSKRVEAAESIVGASCRRCGFSREMSLPERPSSRFLLFPSVSWGRPRHQVRYTGRDFDTSVSHVKPGYVHLSHSRFKPPMHTHEAIILSHFDAKSRPLIGSRHPKREPVVVTVVLVRPLLAQVGAMLSPGPTASPVFGPQCYPRKKAVIEDRRVSAPTKDANLF